MAGRTRDLGPVLRIDAESQGPPGRRTFSLSMANAREQVVLRLEKEQLSALGTAIEQILQQFGEPAGDGEIGMGLPSENVTLDERAGRLGIGLDDRENLFVVVAYLGEGDDEDESNPDVVGRASREAFAELAKQIEQVVNAGRPRCPLCQTPIGPAGHVCIRTNGHFHPS
jgi:uncharacterized repeat protein (TIGR03847 family)